MVFIFLYRMHLYDRLDTGCAAYHIDVEFHIYIYITCQ